MSIKVNSWSVLKELLYNLTLEWLKDAEMQDESPDPDDVIKTYKEIRKYCEDKGKEYYWGIEDCIEKELANEFTESMVEYGGILVLEDNRISLITPLTYINNEPILRGTVYEDYEEYGEYARGAVTFPLEELYEIYKQKYNPNAILLGTYHTHPLTIPLPSQPDVKTAYKMKSVLDGIDNSACGIVIAIGGWRGFYRRWTKEPDAYICYYEEPEYSSGINLTNIWSKKKMLEMTHENLIENSIDNPEKVYLWKLPSGEIRKYEKGKMGVVR